MSKTDVVKRLKATQEQDSAEEYAEGKLAGREWAEQEATAKELQRIAAYMQKHESGRNSASWWNVNESGRMTTLGAADSFALVAWPQRNDQSAPHEFWEHALADDAYRIEDNDFLHGFGDGAFEVWNEVKADL